MLEGWDLVTAQVKTDKHTYYFFPFSFFGLQLGFHQSNLYIFVSIFTIMYSVLYMYFFYVTKLL